MARLQARLVAGDARCPLMIVIPGLRARRPATWRERSGSEGV